MDIFPAVQSFLVETACGPTREGYLLLVAPAVMSDKQWMTQRNKIRIGPEFQVMINERIRNFKSKTFT